jgi:NADH-quinone oxidoreductase subunit J
MSLQVLMFLLLGMGAIATGIGTITRKNPVSAAMNLVAHFFMLSGLYLTLQAQFVAVIQVLVYAGAIMVLVIFVIMLLNLGNEEKLAERYDPKKIVGMFLAASFVVMMLSTFRASSSSVFDSINQTAINLGTTENIGNVLFTNYLFPFEIISLLLLSALVGAVILAKRTVE